MSDNEKKSLLVLGLAGGLLWFLWMRPRLSMAGGDGGGNAGGFNAGAAFLDLYADMNSGVPYWGEGADKTGQGNANSDELLTITIDKGYIPGADGYRRSTVTGERLLDENGDPIPN